MSRGGPPGRTAAERHSQHTGTCQNPASMGRGASVELCPEDEAFVERLWQEAKAAGRPVSRRFIRQRLIAGQTDWDFGGYVLTYLTRHGSRPVDGPVGERVASRLTSRRVA